MSSCVIAAIDLGPLSARVLLHAAGFARLFGARLEVLHVAADASPDHRQRVIDFCTQQAAYEIDLAEEDIVVRTGLVSDAIHREAAKQKARMVMMGSRSHGRLASLLLGSTSEAVLRAVPAPVLLVPPIDRDIIDITDRTTLHCGPVLAAVDVTEACGDQLSLAGELAHLAGQPLLMMTVAPRSLSDHDSATLLRQCAHDHAPVKPRAIVVRHGDVAEEISRCAIAEGAGLVVMGLRASPRRRPGAIASAVLKGNRAFVIAVPAG